MFVDEDEVVIKLIIDALPEFKKYNLLDNSKMRTAFNKIIFILQELGLDLNYHFRWRKTGPYCSGLNSVITDFCLNKIFFGNKKYEFKKSVKKILNYYKRIFSDNYKEENLKWIYLVAYLLKLRQIYPYEDKIYYKGKCDYKKLKQCFLKERRRFYYFKKNRLLLNLAIKFIEEKIDNSKIKKSAV